MKYLVLISVISTALIACGGQEQKTGTTQAIEPAAQSKNSDSFNQSFEKLLTAYYSLKDALVEYDTVQANLASQKIAGYADSLQSQHFTSDSSGATNEKTAKNYTETIMGSALGLVGETDIQNKRKEFQMISDAMYDLVRSVNYDRQMIYRQHCPMAFNDEVEAYWLSNSSTIVNPYLGKKHPKYKGGMVGCGDVTDSVGFR